MSMEQLNKILDEMEDKRQKRNESESISLPTKSTEFKTQWIEYMELNSVNIY